MKIVHSKETVVWCEVCSNCFESTAALEIHMAVCHGKNAVISEFKCDQCECTFVDEVLFIAHRKEHSEDNRLSNTFTDEEAFIPQTDGNDNIGNSTFPSIQEKLSVFQEPTNPHPVPDQTDSSHTITQAGYSLNKMKQVSTLAKHASLPDFIIQPTGPHNINIQCSTGFYEAVPKPSLTSIQVGQQSVVDLILVKCLESRMKKDRLGSNDNHVLRFLVHGRGNAVLHLHHTQQLVQVQGNAAVWFVEHFLRELFISESKKKKLVISDFNSLFNNAAVNVGKEPSAEPKFCNHCGVNFKKNSDQLNVLSALVSTTIPKLTSA